jgi:hypothetical protein
MPEGSSSSSSSSSSTHIHTHMTELLGKAAEVLLLNVVRLQSSSEARLRPSATKF